MDDIEVVLPDTLVAQLIDNANELSHFLQSDFKQLASVREDVRKKMIEKKLIYKPTGRVAPIKLSYAIDGAHIPEVDRASAYAITCAVRVGKDQENNAQSSCLAILPHVPSISSLSSGLMMMQEVMLAVEAVESDPEAVSFIDGSKISVIISVNQFYTAIKRDLPQQLEQWRRLGKESENREPGKTLRLFESRDWLSTYVTHPRIVGNLKLVTTNVMVHDYTPDLDGRFDDKTLASLILEPGEALGPLAIPIPDAPFHISDGFPYSEKFDKIQNTLYSKGENLIYHVYYCPDQAHGVFKIEINQAFLNSNLLANLISWWDEEVATPDLQEPYSYFIADRFAKEAVSVAKKALKEINRRESESWGWFFTQSHRTDKADV